MLEWDFRGSGHTEFLEQLKKEGVISGKELDSRPLLFQDVVYVYEAFFIVSAGRQYNESGPQPLLLTEILAYLNDRGIVEREERDEVLHYFRVLDAKYLDLSHQKIKKNRDRAMKKAESKGRKR